MQKQPLLLERMDRCGALLLIACLLQVSLLHAQAVETTPAPAEPTAGIQASDESIRSGGSIAPLTEEAFVKAAAQAVLAETELSSIARDRTHNLRVNLFAHRSLKDQAQITEALRQAAAAQRVAVPEKLDVDHQAVVSTLRLKPAEKFDATYVAQLRENRDGARALFAQAKNSNSLSVPLRKFADTSLEILGASQAQLMSVQVPVQPRTVQAVAQ